MTGTDFRHKTKHNKDLMTELYRRGYLVRDVLGDVDTFNNMLHHKHSYRVHARFIGITMKQLWDRCKRVK